MTLICCVDNNMGMEFNHRRQSKDRTVSEDIFRRTSGYTLWTEPCSEELFFYGGIKIQKHCIQAAGPNDFCFIEDPDEIESYPEKIDQILFYAWNRAYPADKWFPLSVMKDWVLDHIDEFPGYSHERITVCTYVKKQKRDE